MSVLLLLLAVALMGASAAVRVEPRPTSFIISWDKVEDAAYYDIYIDDVFRKRVKSNEPSTVEIDSLFSNQEYRITWAVRSPCNDNLAAEFITASTTGWDGFYKWTAGPKQDTNKGKMAEMTIEVITKRHPEYGQYLEVWSHIPEGRMKIYPIIEFDDLKPGWTDFLGTEPEAVTYKVTSEKFNKSSILPKTWRIVTFKLDYNSESMTVETKATMGIHINTTQVFSFGFTEDGRRYMDFDVQTPGFIRGFLALCDDEWSRNGEFRLIEM